MFIIFPIPKMTVVYFKLSSFKYTFRRETIIFYSEAKIFQTKHFKLLFFRSLCNINLPEVCHFCEKF